MGLFDFLKKKPKPMIGAELKIPSPAEAAKAGEIPPPEGAPEGLPELEKPITAPRSLEELEIPLPPKELELPKLEFPTLPEEEKKPAALPSLEELEAEVPGELPELEGETPKPAPLAPSVAPAVVAAPKLAPAPKEAPEELEAPLVIRPEAGPLYINLAGYKSVLLTVDDIRDNLKRSNDRLDNLNTLKGRRDSALEAWHSSLENIQRKMIFIDRSLFEGQG